MTRGPAYLAGRVTGFLVRPLLPVAESALAGVLDGLFGEPDALDATYTPTPTPEACALERDFFIEPGSAITGALKGVYSHEDPTWTLDRDRIDEIAGSA